MIQLIFLKKCGLKIRPDKNSLLCHVENLPIDLLFVRDDDIPTLVMDNVCDLGIVGENVSLEKKLEYTNNGNNKEFEISRPLSFGRCRLSIALPKEKSFNSPQCLENLRIATSYPNIVKQYLEKNTITAKIIPISGSVEIAPRLEIADAICDIVSTGRTLAENNLKEVDQVMQSQANLIKSPQEFSVEKTRNICFIATTHRKCIKSTRK